MLGGSWKGQREVRGTVTKHCEGLLAVAVNGRDGHGAGSGCDFLAQGTGYAVLFEVNPRLVYWSGVMVLWRKEKRETVG